MRQGLSERPPTPMSDLSSISLVPAIGRNQMISSAANGRRWSASQRVVSDEFATGNGLTSSTAPMMSNLFPVGAKLTSTGEVILWGYLDDPMSLRRRVRGTQAMVATLKRPTPARRPARLRDCFPGPSGDRRVSPDSSKHTISYYSRCHITIL